MYGAPAPEMIVSSAGDAESEKSANRRTRGSVAVCDPLVPLTVKLYGFGVAPLRPLTDSVLLCPVKMVAGLNVHVVPVEQDKVMLPVKALGADAETV